MFRSISIWIFDLQLLVDSPKIAWRKNYFNIVNVISFTNRLGLHLKNFATFLDFLLLIDNSGIHLFRELSPFLLPTNVNSKHSISKF